MIPIVAALLCRNVAVAHRRARKAGVGARRPTWHAAGTCGPPGGAASTAALQPRASRWPMETSTALFSGFGRRSRLDRNVFASSLVIICRRIQINDCARLRRRPMHAAAQRRRFRRPRRCHLPGRSPSRRADPNRASSGCSRCFRALASRPALEASRDAFDFFSQIVKIRRLGG